MAANRRFCESTSCGWETIPPNLMNFKVFSDEQFESEFVGVFSVNPLNPACKSCYSNFCKLAFALFRRWDYDDNVDIKYSYTKVFIERAYTGCIQALKNCPNNETFFHTDSLLTCTLCMQKCIYQLELAAGSFFGRTWQPFLDYSLGATHLYSVFIQFLSTCKNGCLVVEDDFTELMDAM